MILFGMAYLDAKHKFNPGLLYVGAFLIDMTMLEFLLKLFT